MFNFKESYMLFSASQGPSVPVIGSSGEREQAGAAHSSQDRGPAAERTPGFLSEPFAFL